jgi:Ribbon-helix-helix protein, copG family
VLSRPTLLAHQLSSVCRPCAHPRADRAPAPPRIVLGSVPDARDRIQERSQGTRAEPGVRFSAVGPRRAPSQTAPTQAPIQALYGTGLEPPLMGMRVLERRTGFEPATSSLGSVALNRTEGPETRMGAGDSALLTFGRSRHMREIRGRLGGVLANRWPLSTSAAADLRSAAPPKGQARAGLSWCAWSHTLLSPNGRRPAKCPRGMLASMQRTTVKLPDDLDARLRHEAQRQGVTIAQITRTALEAHLGTGRRRRLGGAAAGRSGASDISERVEEIISSEIASSR